MQRLIEIALKVRDRPRGLTSKEVEAAIDAGAEDTDVQLAVLIAAAFCMYNRMVDGFRARTPSDPIAFRERARQIAAFGYADARTIAVPRDESVPRAWSNRSEENLSEIVP